MTSREPTKRTDRVWAIAYNTPLFIVSGTYRWYSEKEALEAFKKWEGKDVSLVEIKTTVKVKVIA